MYNKPKNRDLLKLTNQLVFLAGGQKVNFSPYEIARPKAEEALCVKTPETNAKTFLQRNFSKLRAWLDANHPNCPTKMRHASRPGVDMPSPIDGKKIVKAKPSSVPRQKKPKKVKKTTVGMVISYVKQSKINPLSDDFLSSFEWRAIRMMALKRHGAICQCCGASAKTGAVINVDHIKPRQEFPELALELDNLQVLCHECNHGKGNWDKTDWRADRLADKGRAMLIEVAAVA